MTETPAPAQTVPAKKSYSADDILNFRQNESVAELFFIAERYLGRTLSATDINTLLYFYDVLGFSTELIVYLIESCVSNNHTSIRYIEKVALGWADQHITTVEEAKQGSPVLGKMYYAVMNAFGITGRKLVSAEIAYISRWTNEYGFDSDIILEACKRTMQVCISRTSNTRIPFFPTGTKSRFTICPTLQNWMRRTRNAKKVPLPLPPIQHPKTSSTISRSAPTTTTNWSRCF